MLLTPAQLHEISQIIADRHSAFIANTIGPEALSLDVVERLKQLGLIDIKVDSIRDAYLYGQVVAAAEVPGVDKMSYDAFKEHVQKNPIPLTPLEADAVVYAQQHAGQYARGLGNRVDLNTGQVAIEADDQLRREMRDKIETATEEAVAKRKSLKQLKSDLGWATQDWARDWERIANTEKHFAMQQGTKDYIVKRHGPDAKVYMRIMPDHCPDCKKAYERNGVPIIFDLAELEGNGTNVGKKRAAWDPVVPPMHPHCFLPGMLVTTDQGQIPIERVRPGDLVLTDKGRWRPVTHFWSSVYEGEVSTIQTNDAVVTATANHPFRSGDAWIPAGLLNSLDKLRYFGSNGSFLEDLDSQCDPPISLKDRCFASILFGFSNGGMPVTAINFNGEFYFREGKIDQEAVNLISDGRKEALTTERLVDPLFSGRFYFSRLCDDTGENEVVGLGFSADCSVESCEVGSSFFWRKLTHSDLLRFRSPFRCAATQFDSMSDRVSAHTEFGGYFFYREQIVEVHSENFEWFELAPKRIGRHGGMVANEVSIVNVSSNQYRGLVYNLTVEEDHTFVVNGFVVHNCQCQLTYVPPGYGFDEEGRMVPGGERVEKSLSKNLEVRKRITFQGIPIDIENPVGSVRNWEYEGERGSTKMFFDYGYVRDSIGADTDGIDVFIGPVPDATMAYVVHQQDPRTGIYDEDKVMLGFQSERQALAAYQIHFDRPDFAVMVSPMPIDAFKRWVAGIAPKPYGLQKSSPTVPLVLKLQKSNVQSAGVVRGSEAMAAELGDTMPAGRRSPGRGHGFNLVLNNPPAHRPPPVDLVVTGNPYKPKTLPYEDVAVKRDPKVYEYQEPVLPRVNDLVIPEDFREAILGTGEDQRNREKIEDRWQQDLAVVRNTVEPEDSKPKLADKVKNKKRKKKKRKKKTETETETETGETLH